MERLQFLLFRISSAEAATLAMTDDSRQWDKLLQAIAKSVVIPIVGRDLLRIRVDGCDQLLSAGMNELDRELEAQELDGYAILRVFSL